MDTTDLADTLAKISSTPGWDVLTLNIPIKRNGLDVDEIERIAANAADAVRRRLNDLT